MSMSHTDYGNQPVPEPEPDAGPIDKRYIKGIPGIVKLVAGVMSMVAFICAAVSLCAGGLAVKPYFMFATMGAFITLLFMWLILLLKLQMRICKCACVNWPFFEFMVYAVIVVFYFFGVLFMSIFACDAARKAACVFGWFGFGAVVTDMVFALRVWLASRKASETSDAPTSNEPKY